MGEHASAEGEAAAIGVRRFIGLWPESGLTSWETVGPASDRAPMPHSVAWLVPIVRYEEQPGRADVPRCVSCRTGLATRDQGVLPRSVRSPGVRRRDDVPRF